MGVDEGTATRGGEETSQGRTSQQPTSPPVDWTDPAGGFAPSCLHGAESTLSYRGVGLVAGGEGPAGGVCGAGLLVVGWGVGSVVRVVGMQRQEEPGRASDVDVVLLILVFSLFLRKGNTEGHEKVMDGHGWCERCEAERSEYPVGIDGSIAIVLVSVKVPVKVLLPCPPCLGGVKVHWVSDGM